MSIDLQVPIWTIDHVAAAHFIEVDTARQYTYRPDFPAAVGPFSKNLWLREDVLAWFAQLPKKDRTSEGRRNTTKAGTPTATDVEAAKAKPKPTVRPYKPRKTDGR